MRTLSFTLPGSDGRPIRGDVRLPDAPSGRLPVLVAIHGFKGFRRWGFWPAMAEAFTGAGIAFVNFDLSHNGVGEGGLEFDEKDLFEADTWARGEFDVGVVLDALDRGELPGSEHLDAGRLVLLGHSRGGGLCVLTAARDARVRAAIAVSPVSTTLRFPEDAFERGKSDGFIPIVNTRTGEVLRFGADAIAEVEARTDLHDIPATYATRLRVPLLVVHGTEDPAVAVEEGRRMAGSAPQGRFLPIEGADHVLGCRHPWAGSNPDFERFLAEATAFVRASV